jgi:hypothetical protein
MIGAPVFRYVLTPGWAGDSLTRAAQAVPSLDLNFAVTKNVGPLVTFTRASSATYIDSAGTLQTAATNVPRFDHNPTTGESLGLLVEEQRTNSIRNNTMVGAVAGTPGTLPTNWAIGGAAGLTSTVVGVGTLNGISYIDLQLVGTSSGTFTTILFEPATQVAATNAQAWAISSYVSIVAGSVAGSSVSLTLNQINSGGSLLAQLVGADIASSLNSSLARFSFASTTNQATIAFLRPLLSFNYSFGVAINITLRIGLPQLEQGAFATSVIPTTTAAVTRSADVASITGANFSSWYRQDEGTVFCASDRQQQIPATDFAQLVFMHDGSANNTINLGWLTASAGQFRVRTANVNEANLLDTVTTLSRRIIGAYAVNNVASSVNGSIPSSDTSVTLPTGINQLRLGTSNDGSTAHNGTIRRLTFFPQRLPNSTLQAITQ